MPSDLSPFSQYGLTWWEKASPAMGTLRVSVTTGVGVWKCAFVTVNTHCAQIQTETGETRKKKRDLRKKWKKLRRGSSNRGWNAQWKSGMKQGESCMAAFPKGQLGRVWRDVYPRVLHHLRVSLRSRWETKLSQAGMTWQNRETWTQISLSLVKRMGGH